MGEDQRPKIALIHMQQKAINEKERKKHHTENSPAKGFRPVYRRLPSPRP